MYKKDQIAKTIKELGIISFEVFEIDYSKGYYENTLIKVVVNQSVEISKKNLNHLPIKFHEVIGDFIIKNSNLYSLKGVPKIIQGDFDCSHNKLKTLGYGPSEVSGSYNCSHNVINQLTINKKIPKIQGDFDCSHNKLVNLVGGPDEVIGNYNCSYNLLKSLTGAPSQHNNLFDCSNNPSLNNIESIPSNCTLNLFK